MIFEVFCLYLTKYKNRELYIVKLNKINLNMYCIDKK